MSGFGKGWKLSDMSKRQRDFIEASGVLVGKPKVAPEVILDKPKGRMPNKTEAAYRRECIDTRQDVTACYYEGLTLRMSNSHRYTPDWVVVTTAGVIELHEVKGSYKLHSYGRAKLAYDQCKAEFPCFEFRWATKSTGGWK